MVPVQQQQQTLPELVRQVSEEPESQTGSGFEQTTLEQADTTQGEGEEPEVAMETDNQALDSRVTVETEQQEEEEEEEEDGSAAQEREEGMVCVQ